MALSKRSNFDLQLDECPTVGQAAAASIAVKGFCTIDAGISSETIDEATGHLQAMSKTSRFASIHPIIAESLLGVESSARIAHYQDDEFGGFLACENIISKMSADLAPYCDGSMGFELAGRTNTLIHHFADDVEFDEVRLEDDDVDFWLPQFARHKIMIVIFLSKGVVELGPYEEEEANRFEVNVTPGMMLLLRPDLMSHTLIASKGAFAFSSFLVSRNTGSMDNETMAPVARQLDQWVVNRLDQIKENQTPTGVWDPAIPRDWQRIMNRLSHKGQKVACRGIGNLAAVSQDAMEWSRADAAGPDTVTDVPLMRWAHEAAYSPDTESWKEYKTSVRHGGFMDGYEMFDPKFFSVSVMEVKGMDPNQRVILECGTLAYFDAGYDKKKLMNSICGIYVGFGTSQWGMVDKGETAAAMAGCGCAPSIHSNRFSFCFGMKGPSMTLDVASASSLLALHCAAEGVQKKGMGLIPPASVAMGSSLLLSPVFWTFQQAAGFLSSEGRCFAFDDGAEGYINADGVTAIVVSPLAELVDNDISIVDEDHVYGAIAGSNVGHCGKAASLAAPNAVATQDVVAGTLRNGHLNGVDVDWIESNCNAQILDDTIEWSALWRSHRSMADTAPLVITSGKTLPGHCQENAALQCFLRALLNSRKSIVPQQLHLRKINPYIDTQDTTGTFSTEMSPLRLRTSFFGTFAHAYGGTNGYVVGFASNLGDGLAEKSPTPFDKQVIYWPGGGGNLDDKMLPDRGYHVYGSFNKLKNPESMKSEGDGVYSYIMTLGENGFEHFEVWLDGKADQILHPGWTNAGKDSPVEGPHQDNMGASWLIDGRDEVYNKWLPAEQSTDAAVMGERVDTKGTELVLQQVTGRHEDSGKPGDQYKITLSTNGKWRSVSWSKLQSSVPFEAVPKGNYYVMSSWTGYDFQEMLPDATEEGLFTADVTLFEQPLLPSKYDAAGSFQIVRDRDLDQVFYPLHPDTVENSSEVVGPSESDPFNAWVIIRKGTYRISFKRKVDESGVDDKSIKIKQLEVSG